MPSTARRRRTGRPRRATTRPSHVGSLPAPGTGEAVALPQFVETVGASGDDLVDIALVAGVEITGSEGESKTRWMASVSSTTPRFGPRCPPVADTLATRNWRISSASWSISSPGQASEVLREWIESNRLIDESSCPTRDRGPCEWDQSTDVADRAGEVPSPRRDGSAGRRRGHGPPRGDNRRRRRSRRRGRTTRGHNLRGRSWLDRPPRPPR